MSFRREVREVPVRMLHQAVVTEATCDACGADCWYAVHRRPVAILSRVRDDGRGNMDIWDLDLCEECKDAVLEVLRQRARAHDRELPDKRSDETVA